MRRWTLRNLARQSSQPRKRNKPFSAASAVLTVDGACRRSARYAFHSVTASFVTAAPSSHTAKARTLRRYFSRVAAACSSSFSLRS